LNSINLRIGRRGGLGRKRDYTPTHWSQYFTTSEDVVINEDGDTFHIYRRGSSGPLLLLLHGGGFSALTWALFSVCSCKDYLGSNLIPALVLCSQPGGM